MKVLSGIENELRAFADEVARYVREHHNDVPKRSGEKWLVERQDGKRVLNQEDFAVPDYLFFLGHHLDEIQTLRSFEPIRRVLVSTELKHAFRPSGDDVVEIALFHYLAPLLARVLEAVDAGHTWDAALDARIRMLDDFLAGGKSFGMVRQSGRAGRASFPLGHNTSATSPLVAKGCRSIRTKALSSNTSSAQCSEAPLRSQSGGGPKL